MYVFQATHVSPIILLHPLLPGSLCHSGSKEEPKEIKDTQHFNQRGPNDVFSDTCCMTELPHKFKLIVLENNS